MRHVLLLLCCSLLMAFPSEAAERESALLHPLEVDPSAALTEPVESLQKRFLSVAREHAGYVLLLRKEVETALKTAGPKDYARSDDALAQLAGVAGTPYALYARFSLTPQNELVLEGRVVKASGERVATTSVKQPRGKGSLLDALGAAVPVFFEQLRRAPPVPAVRPEPPPLVTTLPPPPPPPSAEPVEVKAAPMSPLRSTGLVLSGIGAAGAAIGAIVFATSGTVQRDAQGNILASDAARVTGIRTQQGVGLGVLAAGGAIGIAGAVLALVAPSAPVTASLSPRGDGALFVVGGDF